MRRDAIILLLFGACVAVAHAASAAEPAPVALDDVKVSAEKRAEIAFRQVQLGLERSRSDRAEDLDLVVCVKGAPTGSHRTVIRCATNRKWMQIRAASMSNGLADLDVNGGPGGNSTSTAMARATGANIGRSGLNGAPGVGDNGAAKRDDDKVLTLPMSEYNKLRKRYGELPDALRPPAAAPATGG